jgi:subtilase family serine protease
VVTGIVQAEGQNDLRIADTITVSPREPRAGEPVKLAVTVKGDGSADNRGAELELRVGGEPVSTQRFDLRAGESRRIVTTWKPRAPGRYHVVLTVNCWMEGDNYDNNSRETTVRVR